MKPAIASLALAIVFCGHTMVRKSFLGFANPAQHPPESMMDQHGGRPPGMPPGGEGRWWKNPEIAQKLHLSDEQVQKLDKLAEDHQLQEIDLRADLEKQETILHSQMESNTPDEARILAQVDKVSQARGALAKSRVELVLAERRILSVEQAQTLHSLHSNPPLAPRGFGLPNGGPAGQPEGGPGAGPQGPPGGPPPDQPQGGPAN